MVKDVKLPPDDAEKNPLFKDQTGDDYDGAMYCDWCKVLTKKGCTCGPTAENHKSRRIQMNEEDLSPLQGILVSVVICLALYALVFLAFL